MTPFDELYNIAFEMAGDTDGKIALGRSSKNTGVPTLTVRHTSETLIATSYCILRINKNGRAYIKDMADPPYRSNDAFRAYAELCAFTADLLETFNGE